MTARIEKTVFISYRRTNLPWALAIFQNLKSEGYDVFFDYLSIPSGDFEKIIIENIKARAHFVVVLTPSALERCNEPGDWLRREIETAMNEKRNIVPLMLESFDFGSPSTTKALTGKLENLKKYNGLRLHSEYFFEGMRRLRDKYLQVSLDAVVHPVSESTISVTEEHQAAASEATPIEKEQLTAQEWYEKGLVFARAEDYDEAIRCFDESINLDAKHSYSYAGRGMTRGAKGDLDGAMEDLDNAIRLNPDISEAFGARGYTYFLKGDLVSAIVDLDKAILLNPNIAQAYKHRAAIYRIKGDGNNAIADYIALVKLIPEDFNAHLALASISKQLGKDTTKENIEKARQFMPADDWYNRACLESVCDNPDLAFECLEKAAHTDNFDSSWTWDDPDLQWIRNNPRFTEIVGPKPEET